MFTKIVLIRHGETDFNLEKRYCGSSQIDLNSRGKEQAVKLCKKLPNDIERIYSSDLRRTHSFARLLFERRWIRDVSGLREIKFGIFEGLTYQEVIDKHSFIYKRWLRDPFSVRIPGGESFRYFSSRVKKAWAKIVSENQGRQAAIITHGGPIKVILCDILGLTMKNIWNIQPNLASATIIGIYKKRVRVISKIGVG
ncbi:MAG: histidine phosphatase family protein [Candidatus Omnitrophota bacterium]